MFKIYKKYAQLARLQTTPGHLTAIGQDGQYVDGGVSVDDEATPDASILYTSEKIDQLIDNVAADKADKIVPATAGNVAIIDASGQYQDSGSRINDASPPSPSVVYTSNKTNSLLADKADKIVPVAAGNLAKIDSSGQYQDSGYTVNDSAAPAANILYSSLKSKVFVFGQFTNVPVALASGIILPATAIIDIDNTWNGVAFTAPRAAVYIASAMVRLLNGQVTADRWCQLEMYCGTQVFVDRKIYGGAAAGFGDQDSVWFQLTFVNKLAAGQTISWAMTNALGFAKTVNPDYSKFTIAEI